MKVIYTSASNHQSMGSSSVYSVLHNTKAQEGTIFIPKIDYRTQDTWYTTHFTLAARRSDYPTENTVQDTGHLVDVTRLWPDVSYTLYTGYGMQPGTTNPSSVIHHNDCYWAQAQIYSKNRQSGEPLYWS